MRAHGRASVDPSNPRAFACCDRCQIWFNHADLRYQHDYRGRNLRNLRLLVCENCYDQPQPQLRPRIIPPDPLPIKDPRPERYNPQLTNRGAGRAAGASSAKARTFENLSGAISGQAIAAGPISGTT